MCFHGKFASQFYTINTKRILIKLCIYVLDGSEDDLGFDTSSDESFEGDDDLVDELFASDSESDFMDFKVQ